MLESHKLNDETSWTRYNFMILPEVLERSKPDETRCHICGKTIPLRTAIVRENEILCEQCYAKKYGSKQRAPKASKTK